MKDNFSPLLVTTPRTGSALICKMLGNIGKQTADYRNNLSEFFTISPWFELKYCNVKIFDDIILGIVPSRATSEMAIDVENTNTHAVDFAHLYSEKISMLRQNQFKYMIKLIPYKIDNPTVDFLNSNYDFIYLERRDKLEQLLSYAAFKVTGKTHYLNSDSTVINEITFDPKFLYLLDGIYKEYHAIKQRYPGPTLFYEDLIDIGINEKNILAALNRDIVIDTPMVVRTRPSSYGLADRESLMNNPEVWASYKDEFLKLSSYW